MARVKPISVYSGRRVTPVPGLILCDDLGYPRLGDPVLKYSPRFCAVKTVTGGSITETEGVDLLEGQLRPKLLVKSSAASLESIAYTFKTTLQDHFKSFGSTQIRVYGRTEDLTEANSKIEVKVYKNGSLVLTDSDAFVPPTFGNSTLDETLADLVHCFKWEESAADPRADELSSLEFDPMENANPPTVAGEVQVTTGKFGDALDFSNVSSDILWLPSATLFGGYSGTTIAFYMYPNSTGDQTLLYECDGLGSGDPRVWVQQISSLGLKVYAKAPDSNTVKERYTGSGALTSSAWNLVVVTISATGGSIHILVDDVQKDTTSSGGTPNANFSSESADPGIKIGGVGNGTGDETDAYIDELNIWRKVLTPDPLTALYNSGTGREFTNGSRYLQVDPTVGATVTWEPGDELVLEVAAYSKDDNEVTLRQVTIDVGGN